MKAEGTGLRRAWDEFVGPEATATDHAVTAGATLAGTVAAVMLARRRGAGPGAASVVAALAADLAGGAYVNNTRACARWYERSGQSDGDHLRFAAVHLHPGVVACLDRAAPPPPGGRAAWALAHYGYLLAATSLLRRLRSHRRTLGPVLTAGGLVLDRVLGPPELTPWFAWAYYPKLLLGHAASALWSDQELAAEPRGPGVRTQRGQPQR